jgi:hypothetical protein
MFFDAFLPLTKSIEWLFQELDEWIARAEKQNLFDKIPFSDFKFFEKWFQVYLKLIANQ